MSRVKLFNVVVALSLSAWPNTESSAALLALPPFEGARFQSSDALRISPDGHHVLFKVTPPASRSLPLPPSETNRPGLYIVPIDGSEVRRVNAPLPAGRRLTWFDISPDGEHVLYMADEQTTNVTELFSTAIDGSSTTKLNLPLPADGNVGQFDRSDIVPPLISPDSKSVVYYADQRENDVFELYGVPIGGGMPVRLNDKLPDNSDVVHFAFSLSDDGRRVYYLSGEPDTYFGTLHSAAIEGGSAIQLSPPDAQVVTRVDDVPEYPGFAALSGSDEVIYLARATPLAPTQLFRTDATGGAPTAVETGWGDSVAVDWFDVQDSATGDLVLLTLRPERPRHLLALSLDDMNVTQLSPQLDGQAEFYARNGTPVVTPNGTSVAYGAYSNGRWRVYVTSLRGDTPLQISGGLGAGGPISILVGADDKYVLRHFSGDRQFIYGVTLDDESPASAQVTELSRHHSIRLFGSTVFDASPDGQTVFFRSRFLDSSRIDLYRIPIEGGDAILVGEGVGDFALTDDGSTLVYIGDTQVSTRGLFSVPLRLRWEGEMSGIWSEAGNWGSQPGAANAFVPERATEVFINSPGVTVSLHADDLTPTEITTLHLGGINGPLSQLELQGGSLNILQDLTISRNGQLKLTIQEERAPIIVNRDAILNGVLEVMLPESHEAATPMLGDVFPLLQTGRQLSGRFSIVNLPLLSRPLDWELRYDSQLVSLAVTRIVPEPHSQSLICSLCAIAILSLRLRRPVAICILVCVWCAGPSARGGEPFTERGSWEQRALNFTVEDFESAPTGEIPLNTRVDLGLLDVVVIGSEKSRSIRVDSLGESKNLVLALADDPLGGRPHEVSAVRVDLPIPAFAWGADFTRAGTGDPLQVMAGPSTYSLQSAGVDNGFFGTVEAAPFQSVLFTLQSPTATGAFFRIDDFTFRPIPEPSTVVIGAMGVVFVAAFRVYQRPRR